ncbi:MAG: tetratricopeptide repeat protein [Vampirovibrionia bacterium]
MHNKISRLNILITIFILLILSNSCENSYIEKSSMPHSVYDEPVQSNPGDKQPIILTGKDYNYTLTPKASYKVAALVKSKKHYNWDWNSNISPYDLLLLWGDLANPDIDNKINFSQSNRWYHSRYQIEECPFERSYINNHAANTHIIPADENIKRSLDSLKAGQNIYMEGYLVYLDGTYQNKKVQWHSSLRRTDSGNGACEVLYLEKIFLIDNNTNTVDTFAVKENNTNTNLSITPANIEQNLSGEEYYERGRESYKNKDFDKAILYYKEALKILPDNTNIKNCLNIAENELKKNN